MAGMPKQTPLPFPDAEPARPNPTEPSSATTSGPALPDETGADRSVLAVAVEPADGVVGPADPATAIGDSVASTAAEAADIESTRQQPDPAQTELPMPAAAAPTLGLDARQSQARRPWWARLLGSF